MIRSVTIALVSGALFAVGLAVSGMTDPAKVEAFLTLGPGWDPALAFVMGGAIGVHALAYVAQRRLSGPIGASGTGWVLAPLHGVDGWLIGGAAAFGVGWGLSGWCPGPAFVSLPAANGSLIAFVVAMIAGLSLGGMLRRAIRRPVVVVPGPAGTTTPVVVEAPDPTESVCG